MLELDDDDRRQIAHRLGMKPAEIVAAAGVPFGDGDDTGAVVQTHDGQRVLLSPTGEVSPWDGPMPGAEPDADDESDLDDEPAAGASAPASDPDAVPDGTADDVLAWVGDDRERAARALQAEQGRDKPRSGLSAQLEKLAGLA